MAVLTKTGKNSKRNLDKKFRAVSRNPDGSARPMELIKGAYAGNEGIKHFTMVFNGVYGDKNWDSRLPCMVLKVGTKASPGKSKQKGKKHRGGIAATIGKSEDQRIDRLKFERRLRRWNDLHDAIVCGFHIRKGVHGRHVTDEDHYEFAELKSWLKRELGPKFNHVQAKALRRRESLLGMLKKGQL